MWPRDEFSDFFRRSRCGLTSLTLGPMLGVMFNDSDVVSLLQSTPTLAELKLHDSTGSLSGRVITPELCQCLHIPPLVPATFTQFTGPLVLNLEKLALGVNLHLAAFDEDVLVRMILSRCQLIDMSGPEGSNFLRRLELRFISDDDDDYLFDHIKSSVLAIKSMSIMRWPGPA
ncbi:hypothetical protein VKT23_010618 [Stygiomarasmius scandens]|uniref:Uncharacterized protein n=1 Tax=Marasmiellus scandens TaxID=2682957 RepID=A0ABR1JBL1_9AGAR